MTALLGYLFLRSSSSGIASLIPIAALILLISASLPQLLDILQTVRALGEGGGVDFSSVSTVLRGLGIALITRFASDVCLDCGQRSLGDAVDYFGQVAIVSLAIPSVLTLVEKITGMDY